MADDSAQDAMALLEEAEACLATLGEAFDEQALTALRGIVSKYQDAAGDPIGETTASLSTLLSRLLRAGACDRQAIGVHMRAWRLLLTDPPDKEAAGHMLSGLRAVSDLYSPNRAA